MYRSIPCGCPPRQTERHQRYSAWREGKKDENIHACGGETKLHKLYTEEERYERYSCNEEEFYKDVQ